MLLRLPVASWSSTPPKFPISRLNPTPFRKVIGGVGSVGPRLLGFPILNLLPAFKGTEEIAGENPRFFVSRRQSPPSPSPPRLRSPSGLHAANRPEPGDDSGYTMLRLHLRVVEIKFWATGCENRLVGPRVFALPSLTRLGRGSNLVASRLPVRAECQVGGLRGISSVGRARQWHCRGQGFEPPILHFS